MSVFLKFTGTCFGIRNQLAQSGYIFHVACTRWNILTFEYVVLESHDTRLEMWSLTGTRKQILHLISSRLTIQKRRATRRGKLMSFASLQLSKAAVHLHVTSEENGRLSACSETYTVIRNFGVWRARTGASLMFLWRGTRRGEYTLNVCYANFSTH